MKCVAIGGVPATGKTTLVKKIYDKMPKINFQYGLVKGHYDKENNIALLGLYNQNNTFLGTARLSMGVNKQFLQYISMVQRNIIFEGDRLFSLNNLIKLNELYELRIIMLVNSPETLLKRHKDRNDSQTDKFLKGRATKIKNIKEHFGGIIGRIETYTLTNLKESETLSNNIYDWLKSQKGHNG